MPTGSSKATFDGHFTFSLEGTKVSRDVKASELALAQHLRECGEAWIREHTNGRMTAKGDVTVAYHYGWGEPSRARRYAKRLILRQDSNGRRASVD